MLDHGEDPWTAAWRETREETGVELSPVPRLIGIDHRADVGGTGPVLDCFFYGGTLADGTSITLSPEHDRHAVFSLNELADTLLAEARREASGDTVRRPGQRPFAAIYGPRWQRAVRRSGRGTPRRSGPDG